MAPPSHTDIEKQRRMRVLADTYLSQQAIAQAGLLDNAEVQQILQCHEDSNTSVSERVQLDAIINHMLSVQTLHQHFVTTDVPSVARDRAQQLGWYAQNTELVNV